MISKKKDFMTLSLILATSLAVRLPFLARGIFHCDSWGYCMGGLYQFAAHPPGFAGFCASGFLLNQLIHSIVESFLIINIAATLVGIAFVYKLCELLPLHRRTTIIVTLSYSLSICLLYFSNVVLSYAVEGMFAAIIGYYGLRSIRSGSRRDLWLATLFYSTACAFRTTTLVFMAPLLIFVYLRTRLAFRTKVIPAVTGIVLALALMTANSFLVSARQGFAVSAGRAFWDLMVFMPVGYDNASLGIDPGATEAMVPSLHMPFIEALYVLRGHIGWIPLPSLEPGLHPSLAHAARLAVVQFAKVGFYLLFSAPILLVLPFLRRRKESGATLDWPAVTYLALWVCPPFLFFIVGHLGSFGYLQVLLAAIYVLVGMLIERALEAGPGNRIRIAICAGPAVASLAFFVAAHPYWRRSERHDTANVVALQYTGPAIREYFATARATLWRPDGAQLADVPKAPVSDKELLRIARRIHWFPDSYFRPPAIP